MRESEGMVEGLIDELVEEG